MKALLRKIKQLLKDKRFRKIWYRGVSTIAAIVVFITTYALVLPAITMESEASCGVPAHQHSSDCYEEQLICDKEESDGHHHTDDCYTTTSELTCELPEHKHDESCRDEEGNLTCRLSEHTHEDGCYEEHKELTCTLQESDGHHHDSSCYEQVLTCGREAHIHSTECYKEESLAVAASTSATATTAATAVTASAGEEASHDSPDAVNAASVSDSDETAFENTELSGTASNQDADPEKSLDTSEPAGTDITDGSDHNAETNHTEDTDTENADKAEPTDSAETTDAATAATTGVLPEPVEQEELSDGYVPTLDPINMEQVLDKHTGFYYYHTDETTDSVDGKASETLESSADITAWKKVNDDTKLAPTDLIKAYFAYTIPAGRLNETNQVARYRLPSNIHPTDDQIIAINQAVNGVAAAYVDQDTLQVTDADSYNKYLGAEAVEGTRTPDETLVEGTQEYISAVVKAENVFENTLDKDGNYIDANGNIADGPGEYLGQDLIFVFTPYTIEKNQITYDKDGNPTAAGEKITGWFACDFNTDQIDWVEEETDADLDNTTVEKTADIHFAARDDSLDTEEITQTLKMTEQLAAPEEAAGEEANAVRESSDAETAASETTEEKSETSSTKAPAETSEEPGAETAETAASASTSESEAQEPQYRDGTLIATGDDYTITLDYTADACIPEDAELQVREITAETDPEAYEACLEQAKASIKDSDNKDDRTTVDQKASRFFDIEIIAKDGEKGDSSVAEESHKIEPKAAVKVNIQLNDSVAKEESTSAAPGQKSSGTADSAEAAEQNDPTVLHFADHGVEQIESTVSDSLREAGGNASDNKERNETGKEIRFEAESFSIYGVVYSTIATTYITASGETYEITVTYDENAGIPEDAELKVREIKAEPGSEEFGRYLAETTAELEIDASNISFARYFDIEIIKEGQKIEPKIPVRVTIQYKDPVSKSGEDALQVVHFADEETEVISEIELSEDKTQIEYQQSSFSVTGTIINGASNETQYIALIRYPENSNNYYIINNDGTLTKVEYKESAGTVDIEEPMMWTYGQVSAEFMSQASSTHLYFKTEATGFNWRDTATDYYYRYVDPNSESGITEETADNNSVTLFGSGDWAMPSERKWANATSITYANNRLYHDGNNYLGVELDEEGNPVRLKGKQTQANAAYVVFATADKVPAVDYRKHTVDHIDISISGSSEVTVPLAYGTYYYGDPSNPSSMQKYEVSTDTDLVLEQDDIRITPEDMKRATIKAYDKNGKELDDAFVVNGYSSNASNEFSNVQVRIEGRFKVADLNDQGENDQQTKQQRIDNKITYTVSALKPLTFPLIETDHNYGQLYEKQADGSFKPLSITVDVNMSASFDYWDEDNECPALKDQIMGAGTRATWQNGGIPTSNLSGMDFVLGGDADDAGSQIVAVEITKAIMDENHHLIEPEQAFTQSFDVYGSNTEDHGTAGVDSSDNVIGLNTPTYTQDYSGYEKYKKIHSKDVKVGESGMGLVYDYDVDPGMYYISEDASKIPTTITDKEGTEWTYLKTYIETEYVWRNDEYTGRHHSKNYTNRNTESYNSIPEVAGAYTGSHDGAQQGQDTVYGSATFINYNAETGQAEEKHFRNGFLEFYVYNIYTSGTELEVEKTWIDEDGNTKLADDSDKIPDDARIDVTIQRYKQVEKTGTLKINQELTGDALDDPAHFSVQYTLEDKNHNVIASGTYNGIEGTSISGLTIGETYTLYLNSKASGYTIDGGNTQVSETSSVKIDSETKEYNKTNALATYVEPPKYGSLVIHQNVTGNAASEGSDSYRTSYVIKKGETPVESGSFSGIVDYKVMPLPVGDDYTVEIRNTSTDAKYTVGNKNTQVSNTVNVVQSDAPEYNNPTRVEFTNTLTKEVGAIRIKQTLTGSGAETGQSSYSVNYTVKKGETIVKSGSYTGTAGATIDNLDPGEDYEVDLTCSVASGYEIDETTQIKSALTVRGNETKEVEFSNNITKNVPETGLRVFVSEWYFVDDGMEYSFPSPPFKGNIDVKVKGYSTTNPISSFQLNPANGWTITDDSIDEKDFYMELTSDGTNVIFAEFPNNTHYVNNFSPNILTTKGIKAQVPNPLASLPSGSIVLKGSNSTFDYRQYTVGDTVNIKCTLLGNNGNYGMPFTVYRSNNGNKQKVFSQGQDNERTKETVFTFSDTVLSGTTTYTVEVDWGGSMNLSFGDNYQGIAPHEDILVKTVDLPPTRTVLSADLPEIHNVKSDDSVVHINTESLKDNSGAVGNASAETSKTNIPDVKPKGSKPVIPGYDLIVDESFNNNSGKMVIHLPDGGSWKTTVGELERVDEDGNPYIYFISSVDEYNVPAGTVAAINKDGTFQQVVFGDHDETGSGHPNTTLGLTNNLQQEKGSVVVTKSFSGADTLPETFKITATYNDGTGNKTVVFTTSSDGMTGTGTAADPYTWTIDDLPPGTVVTFTESGYELADYTVKVNGSATAEPQTASASNLAGKASFVNVYEHKIGSVSFTKKDEKNEGLPGAVFALYKTYEGGKLSDPLIVNDEEVKAVSGAGGTVSFINIPAGTYYMKETEAPSGYVLDPRIYLVRIEDKEDNSKQSKIIAADGIQVTEIENTPDPTNPDAPEAQVENHKRIDALRDGNENPDSPHTGEDMTDLYRLYLDYKINSVQEPEGVDLLFVLDNSGSMHFEDFSGNPNRAPTIEKMLNGEAGLISEFMEMNENNRWAAVGFNGPHGYDYQVDFLQMIYGEFTGTSTGGPYEPEYYLDNADDVAERDSMDLSPGGTWSRQKGEDVRISLPKEEGSIEFGVLPRVYIDKGSTRLTNYTAGLWRAEQLLKGADGKKTDDRKKIVIFISDGIPTLYIDCAGTLDNANSKPGSSYYPDQNGTGGCPDETLEQVNAFVSDMKNAGYGFGDNMEFYTVGFGNSIIAGTAGKDLLKNMVKAAYDGEVPAGHFLTYDDGNINTVSDTMKKGLGGSIGLYESFSKIKITDNLSKYVDLFGLNTEETNPSEILKAAGTKVTMTDPENQAQTKVLYSNGQVTEDGRGILQSVTYNNKVVTATFEPTYKALPGITYTLSFDVKATEAAYKEYAENVDDKKPEYGLTVGDTDTDYLGTDPINATSSGKAGFNSNTSATVTYDHEKNGTKKPESKDYHNPVIQVFEAPIQFLKTDQLDQPVAGAEFNLYNSKYDPAKGPDDSTNAAYKINKTVLKSTIDTTQGGTQRAVITADHLKHGTYYLVETKAPDGYKSLDGPIKIEVKVDTTVETQGTGEEQTVDTKDTVSVKASMNGTEIKYPTLKQTEAGKNDWELKVVNQSGVELPATGGPGTRLFYLLGGLFTALALALLKVRRPAA